MSPRLKFIGTNLIEIFLFMGKITAAGKLGELLVVWSFLLFAWINPKILNAVSETALGITALITYIVCLTIGVFVIKNNAFAGMAEDLDSSREALDRAVTTYMDRVNAIPTMYRIEDNRIFDDDNNDVSMNFYPPTRRRMIQLGNNEEDRASHAIAAMAVLAERAGVDTSFLDAFAPPPETVRQEDVLHLPIGQDGTELIVNFANRFVSIQDPDGRGRALNEVDIRRIPRDEQSPYPEIYTQSEPNHLGTASIEVLDHEILGGEENNRTLPTNFNLTRCTGREDLFYRSASTTETTRVINDGDPEYNVLGTLHISISIVAGDTMQELEDDIYMNLDDYLVDVLDGELNEANGNLVITGFRRANQSIGEASFTPEQVATAMRHIAQMVRVNHNVEDQENGTNDTTSGISGVHENEQSLSGNTRRGRFSSSSRKIDL